MADQRIDLDKVSLVETFPYLHRDGSGKFKQDLLEELLEKNPEFAKLVYTWVAECMQLEKEGATEAWAAQNSGEEEPPSVIYAGGLVVAKVLEKIYGSEPLSLAGIDVELRQTTCGKVLYVEDHPSYWMMKRGDKATFERFRATMQTWPALTNSIRHGANFLEQLGESGRLQIEQEAATLSAIKRHGLDITQVQAWCPSGLHTAKEETIEWAAEFARKYCGGDRRVTIRLGFSERVRHMTTAERERLERLHDDAATAALVKELLKSNSGIPRLADERWLRVSAPQGLAAEAPRHVWLACRRASYDCSTTKR